MAKSIRVRKVLGGGMRQVGFMAATALYALDNNVERLAEDHQRASEISAILKNQSYVEKVELTETNIVIFYLNRNLSEEKFLNDLLLKDIKISNMGQGKLRIVTHLDYTSKMHEKFLDVLSNYN